MSQDNLIKLESVGGPNGAGKGHIIRTNKNKKNTPARLEVKKYNPIAKAHTIYKETK